MHAGMALRRQWIDEDGQDIAEYAVMLAMVLVIVVGTIRLVGSNSKSVFAAERSNGPQSGSTALAA